MAAALDIIGMMVIRASIVMIILNLMINLHEALYKNTERIYLNDLITAPAQTISADLKLAGPDASGSSAYKRFLTLGSSDMKFFAVNTSGTRYVVRFYLSGTTLYRGLCNTTSPYTQTSSMEIARNVTQFRVRYFLSNGSTTTSTSDLIKSVHVQLTIQSTITESVANAGTSDAGARTVKWEKHFFPENL